MSACRGVSVGEARREKGTDLFEETSWRRVGPVFERVRFFGFVFCVIW